METAFAAVCKAYVPRPGQPMSRTREEVTALAQVGGPFLSMCAVDLIFLVVLSLVRFRSSNPNMDAFAQTGEGEDEPNACCGFTTPSWS